MYTIAIAGSTKRTTQVAETILKDSRFEISFIITPSQRKIGRKQKLVNNPLHQFAKENKLPTVLVDKKIAEEVKKKIDQQEPIDLLLVVDFGYFIPQWLLDLPKIAPLNIHPSKLPDWRGSSPGQFVLLNGDQNSAVTLMVINEKMDEGPVIAQLPFSVNQSWTQVEYYQHSFDLICESLGDLIEQFVAGKLKATPQPADSPTPVAKRIRKEDAFYSWDELKQAMNNKGKAVVKIERACRAYYPWPKLWTKVPTKQGEKRMIIHQCSIKNNLLVLDQVQLEGKTKTPWNGAKNIVVS